MRWHKTAGGHGDTLDGQLMAKTYRELRADMEALKAMASTGGPAHVLPRWKGELRRRILLLPPLDRTHKMSMSELHEVRAVVDEIKRLVRRYDARRIY
jgi:hypothetical protein